MRGLDSAYSMLSLTTRPLLIARSSTKRSPSPPNAMAAPFMRKPSTSSSRTWSLSVKKKLEVALARQARCCCLGAALLVTGCANSTNDGVLVDPLKQRLIAREDVALQNLLFARIPAYAYQGAGGSSFWDAPYEGTAIEPPLPDLSLLPEDLPPWDEVEALLEAGGP